MSELRSPTTFVLILECELIFEILNVLLSHILILVFIIHGRLVRRLILIRRFLYPLVSFLTIRFWQKFQWRWDPLQTRSFVQSSVLVP
jgi:hypothetical protein